MSIASKTTTCCIAASIVQAGQLVDLLRDEGFAEDSISLLFPFKQGISLDVSRPVFDAAVLGGASRWAAEARLFTIIPLGRVVAIGPVMGMMNSTATEETVEELSSILRALGTSTADADYYEDRLKAGDILIAIHSNDAKRLAEAEMIFEQVELEHVSRPKR
jgi:hypothetical protein